VTDYRLLQIFLSSKAGFSGPGIFEVSGDEDQNFVCTCPGYKVKHTCRHIRFVQDKIKKNNGTYPLEVGANVPEEEVTKALKSSDTFREFLLKHGKIEVY
jgi:hypothetical protein